MKRIVLNGYYTTGDVFVCSIRVYMCGNEIMENYGMVLSSSSTEWRNFVTTTNGPMVACMMVALPDKHGEEKYYRFASQCIWFVSMCWVCVYSAYMNGSRTFACSRMCTTCHIRTNQTFVAQNVKFVILIYLADVALCGVQRILFVDSLILIFVCYAWVC